MISALNFQKKYEYLSELQSQMEENEEKRKREVIRRQHLSQRSDAEGSQYQDRLQKIRERKLQQLRAYNIPEKYIREIERKSQPGKTRFSLAGKS